ncbi:ATP synthase subunit H-domain-containing protein [Mycena alexandri]|uniref:ATP synthase subunit H-domain-containing protein n=1 Tax=Mycena alexandri TaxID=1745969 RepID=A0AAD6RXS1_9AGAR|nr:ATP synthase subunit H-domain-containing protein [Mycena alexandri]
MSTLLPIFFLLALVVGLMTCAALFTPKGPQQVVIRTAIMLTLAACYLMWMVTYLAQLHPLIGMSVQRWFASGPHKHSRSAAAVGQTGMILC